MNAVKKRYTLGVLILAASFLLAGCSNSSLLNHPPTKVGTPTISPGTAIAAEGVTGTVQPGVMNTPADPTASPTDTPTVQPPSVWVAPYLPAALQQALQSVPAKTLSTRPEDASLHIEVEAEGTADTGASKIGSQWIYALVAPFPTVTDGVSQEDLRGAWKGGESGGPFAGRPILVDESTLGVFTARWGAPASQAVKVVPPESISDDAWQNRPSWALVPFDAVEPRWKVLEVDGKSPLRKDFDPAGYSLTVPVVLTGDTGASNPITAQILQAMPSTNREANKLTTVVMTGVTALVRGTSNTMYAHGADYPAQDIGGLLREADILHISNEVPFAEDCPAYVDSSLNLVFCTSPNYIKLLEDIGTDVVELTGDHFADWGPKATLYTLQMYKDRGWPYYGGGANLEEAKQPALFESNGNKIAFIGCNAKGGGYATASDTVPGAAACDYEYMHSEISKLASEGYLTIATFQHQEYYSYKVLPQYRPDFTGMADAGAVIVSGSQAHQPQNMEFYRNSFIHYGLGNLFFDQYTFGPETRQAFIDRHVFYKGRYLGTELITIQFVDLARSRLMTPEERAQFLQVLFRASGW